MAVANAGVANTAKDDYLAHIHKVTKTQEIRVMKMLRDFGIPEDKQNDAIDAAVQMLLEANKRTHIVEWLETPEDKKSALAMYFPPAGVAPNDQVTAIVTEAFQIYEPLQHKKPGGDAGAGQQQNQGSPHAQQIMTATEKQEMERTIVLAKKIRIPKFNDKPYDAFYPHHWLGLGKTFEDVFSIWKQRIDNLFKGKPIQDSCTYRFQHLEEQMELWFKTAVDKAFTTETLDYDSARGFFPHHRTVD